MILYPAMDLMGGKVVRLQQGRFDQATTYSDDPARALRVFAEAGSEWAHVVDLDGARAGRPMQHDLIADLAGSAPLKLQVAGGFRTGEHLARMFDEGVARVVIGSLAVKQPVDNLILSNSLRAAVTGFARTLANEVAAFGITVNNIMPGYTRTERVEQLADTTATKEGLTPKDIVARFENQIPMRRLGEPEEFAALAVFLASNRASYITGQSIAVDGGWIKALLQNDRLQPSKDCGCLPTSKSLRIGPS